MLADDGTLWLNLGDSYAANRGHQVPDSKHIDVGNNKGMKAAAVGLKPKDLIGTPWRVAFALQADGWYLRQDIIWSKPNPMPESVTDRCTKAHEYIFLLSKSPKYYYDHAAVREDAVKGASGSTFNTGKTAEHQLNRSSDKERAEDGKRNRRSVWTVTPKPYKGAHFATFPPDLIAPCILAGSPVGGMVLDPFMGSGTTAQVAELHGRSWLGIELNPAYCELIKDRMT